MIVSYIKNGSSFKIELISEMEIDSKELLDNMGEASIYHAILKEHGYMGKEPEYPAREKGEPYEKDYGLTCKNKLLSIIESEGVSDVEVSNGGNTINLYSQK